MIFRLATTNELDQIYMMGFDVWSENGNVNQYLRDCQSSPKYKRGLWWVLENKAELVCSLITYELTPSWTGIGSIATPPGLRKRGYASTAINSIVKELEINQMKDALFLYADIGSAFYENFQFEALPNQLQLYPDTSCMVRTKDLSLLVSQPNFSAPKYF